MRATASRNRRIVVLGIRISGFLCDRWNIPPRLHPFRHLSASPIGETRQHAEPGTLPFDPAKSRVTPGTYCRGGGTGGMPSRRLPGIDRNDPPTIARHAI